MQLLIIEGFFENSAPFVISNARHEGGINLLVILIQFTPRGELGYPYFCEKCSNSCHLMSISEPPTFLTLTVLKNSSLLLTEKEFF